MQPVVREREFPLATLDDVMLVGQYAKLADELPVWGTAPRQRDRELRKFIPTEPILCSALGTTIMRYCAFGYRLTGPRSTAARVQQMLNTVERGKGWDYFLSKYLLDLFTADNGTFAQVIRTADSPLAPVVTLEHLDSARCIRTGLSDEPVDYLDDYGTRHRLKKHQVIMQEEMPSAMVNARGLQYCVLTRMLRAAQIMRDIHIYKYEKISGRRHRAIHIVGGVPKRIIEDAVRQNQAQASADGFTRYIDPVVLSTLDPTQPASHVQIDLASLPDGFDEETSMRWYINQLALAFGADYQDFAPLPGGNLGTAQQSQVLHLKGRGKGPARFMRQIEHIMNFHGIMPRNVTFAYGEQDIAENMEQAELRKRRAEEREIRLRSGEITIAVAQQMAYDAGDLTEEEYRLLGGFDRTSIETVSASIPA